MITQTMNDPKKEVRALVEQIMARTGLKVSRIASEAGLAASTLSRQMKGTADSTTSTTTLTKLRNRFPEVSKQGADDPAYLAEVANRIARARTTFAPNASDEAIANAFGITPEALRTILSGEEAPSLYVLRVIASRLRVTADFLLSGRLAGLSPVAIHRLLASFPDLASGTEDTLPSRDTDPA